MKITDNYDLTGAYQVPEYDDSLRYSLRVYDDMFGQLYVAGFEHGPTMLIRADSLQTAWEIWVDETPPIDPDEVNEAHGIPDGEIFDADILDADIPDLVEGYHYQSNVTGTGIVNMGHYAWLEQLTPELAGRLGIVVQVSEIQ
jgi:hypothetical protein